MPIQGSRTRVLDGRVLDLGHGDGQIAEQEREEDHQRHPRDAHLVLPAALLPGPLLLGGLLHAGLHAVATHPPVRPARQPGSEVRCPA